ncbi:MAG: PD-(D/E)XK nuclease family protein, partial [Lachnospiraceae bacterium]|nr:PD-(D/E)XK nuclease family protein [Lachnospiraceae bacterium]
GIEHLKVASIPMSRDYVIIGDIERTRIENISTLIFTGVNMGIIPRVSSGSACLTSNDRERLKERDIVLAPSSRERAFIQQFYLYMLMTKPKESLYITYSDSDMSGKALEPAFLIKKLEKMYGKERLYKDTPYLSISREFDFVRVLEKLSSHKELNEEDRACIAYLANESFYKTILEKVTSAPDYGKTYRNLTEDEIAAVYGDSIKGSISSFEAFASCPMKYYLDYGIGLDEIDDGEFDPLKRGTLTHKAMEQYGKLLAGINKTYTDVSDSEREKLIDEAVAEALNSINDAELKESKRKEYLITTIRKVLVRTTEQIKNNALESGFIPSKNECNFKLYNDGDERIPLSNGKSMRFEGKIDRIDTKESGDTITYRVIDYKSSAKELEMSKVYEGLSLQLITYLDGAETVLKAENRDKNIVSDGAYYYPLLNPIIDVASNDVSDSEIADEIKKALLLNGVGPADSKIKEGTNEKSRSYSGDTLNIVKRFVDKKRKEIGDAILSGKIKPEPYYEGSYGINSCQYCAYNSVCGFDMSLRTCKTKRKVKGKADEIIEMMKKETEGEE